MTANLEETFYVDFLMSNIFNVIIYCCIPWTGKCLKLVAFYVDNYCKKGKLQFDVLFHGILLQRM